MVEWLLANSLVTGWSLSAYVSQFKQTVNATINNQFALWTIVIVFILMLRTLTSPRR
jgi:hypothetical protein